MENFDRSVFFETCFDILKEVNEIACEKIIATYSKQIEYIVHGDLDINDSAIEHYIDTLQDIIDGNKASQFIIPTMTTFLNIIKNLMPSSFSADDYSKVREKKEVIEEVREERKFETSETIYDKEEDQNSELINGIENFNDLVDEEDEEEESFEEYGEFEIRDDFHEETYEETLDIEYYEQKAELFPEGEIHQAIKVEEVFHKGNNESTPEITTPKVEEIKENIQEVKEVVKEAIQVNEIKNEEVIPEKEISQVIPEPIIEKKEELKEEKKIDFKNDIIRFNLYKLLNISEKERVSYTTNSGMIGFDSKSGEVSYMAYFNGEGVETFSIKNNHQEIHYIILISKNNISISNKLINIIDDDKRKHGYNYYEHINEEKGTVKLKKTVPSEETIKREPIIEEVKQEKDIQVQQEIITKKKEYNEEEKQKIEDAIFEIGKKVPEETFNNDNKINIKKIAEHMSKKEILFSIENEVKQEILNKKIIFEYSPIKRKDEINIESIKSEDLTIEYTDKKDEVKLIKFLLENEDLTPDPSILIDIKKEEKEINYIDMLPNLIDKSSKENIIDSVKWELIDLKELEEQETDGLPLKRKVEVLEERLRKVESAFQKLYLALKNK